MKRAISENFGRKGARFGKCINKLVPAQQTTKQKRRPNPGFVCQLADIRTGYEEHTLSIDAGMEADMTAGYYAGVRGFRWSRC